MSKYYKLVWEMDLVADSPEEAVEMAIKAQREEGCLYFKVTKEDGTSEEIDGSALLFEKYGE